jgi:polar amino acid transport system substrate-binding protein
MAGQHMPLPPDIISDLAPTGVLRAGINLSNFLLVTKVNSTGDPEGVAPDLAGEVAMRLGVSVKYVTFKSSGELADAIAKDVWDIGLIGAEPQRAETIAFTSAYAEIDATYLVPSDSRLNAIADVDSEGVRIAVTARSAYGLWLDRNIKHADLIRSDTLDSAYEEFVNAKLRAHWPQAATSVGSGKIAGLPHPRRTVYVGSAGNRHLPEKPGWCRILARLC